MNGLELGIDKSQARFIVRGLAGDRSAGLVRGDAPGLRDQSRPDEVSPMLRDPGPLLFRSIVNHRRTAEHPGKVSGSPFWLMASGCFSGFGDGILAGKHARTPALRYA